MVPFYLKKTRGIILFTQQMKGIIQKTLLHKLIPGLFAFFLIANNLFAGVSGPKPVNTPADAYTLPLNGSGTGVIDPAGSVDYWKVTTNGDGQLNVTLSPLSNRYLWIYLYDNDGVILLTANNSNGTFTVSQDGLAEGTYYIKVNAYYNTDTSSYILSNTLTPASVDNDNEPNDIPEQANTLAINSTTTGHTGYYYQNRRDTFDWYKITTPEDGLLQLKLTSNNGQYVWAYLYDNNGNILLNSNNFNGTGYINTDGLAAGTYYVRINTYYNNGFAPYTLTDSLFSPTQANDNEPNNTLDEANTLAINSTTTGHIGYYYDNRRDSFDWYKITTPEDGFLQLKLTSHNNQYVWAYLYDNNGNILLNSNNFNESGYINTDGLAAGTYYVRINTYYNNGFAPYTLTDSLFTYNDNDTEPNGYFSQAATLSANRTTTGHVGFYYNNARDSVDTWKVNYTGTDGNLNFTFNLLPHKINGSITYVWFQLFRDTTAAPIFTNNFNSASTTLNFTGLTQGYYYIKVFTYYSGEFSAYSINTSFQQVDIAQISLSQSSLQNTCNSGSLTYNLSGSHSPYTVSLYKDGVLFNIQTTSSDNVIFDALNDGNYYATVYGDGATDDAFSQSEVTQFLPPTPTGLTTTDIGINTATLNWQPLSCVSNYRVQYKVTGTPDWTTVTPPTDNTSYSLTALTPSTSYTWQLASLDSANGLMSQYSDTLTFTTLADTATLPVTFLNIDRGLRNKDGLYQNRKLNWAIFGNPISSNSMLQLQLDKKANVAIQLISIDGKVIQTINKGNTSEGIYSIPLHLGLISKGMYEVRLVVDNQVYSKKIIK